MNSASLPANTTLTRVADLLVAELVAAGIDTVFGLPGGSIVPLFDALYEHPSIRLISSRHESGAMFAAAAYARLSGKPAIVLVTSGPGALNTVTGMAVAQADGAPVIVIAGDVARGLHGKNALQDGSEHGWDVARVAAPVAKAVHTVGQPGHAVPILRQAIDQAISGRKGVVFINLPMDVSSATVMPTVTMRSPPPAPADMSAVGRTLTAALATCRHPVIFAGSGARAASASVVGLAEALQIPVMTTPKGKGVMPEDHPLSLGVFGHGGHQSATEYVEAGLDGILVLGSGLSDPATNGWAPALEATQHFIQVDIDESRIGKVYQPTRAVVGDVGAVVEAMLASVISKEATRRRYGLKHQSSAEAVKTGAQGLISPQRALWELQQVMPGDAIYSIDIGEHLLFATHYLTLSAPDSFLAMTGLASMGTSIAGAIGASLAKPWRAAVAVCGDGCFVMALSDVLTAAHEQRGIVIAVLNDQRYGMVELGTKALYGRTQLYPAGPLDVCATAESLGARARRVSKPEELLALRDWLGADPNVPKVLDIHIDPSIAMAKNKRFESLLETTRGT